MDLGRQSIVDWAEAAPEDGGAEFTPAEERFVVEAPIGKGGMGEVANRAVGDRADTCPACCAAARGTIIR